MCERERECEEEPMAKRPRFASVSRDEVVKTVCPEHEESDGEVVARV